MSVTLADVLELPVVRRGMPELLAGEDAVDRMVRWAHVLELPDPRRLLRGGELVLTTGLGVGGDSAMQRRWVEAVAEQGAAALAIELGLTYRERVPQAIVRACKKHGLPLVAFGRRVAYVEVTEAINSAILDRQGAVLRTADTVQQRLVELVLREGDAADVLEALAEAIGAPVVLEGPESELVYCATGPAGQESTQRALDDLHRYEGRGARTDGAYVVDLDSRGLAWGRLVGLGIEAPLDDYQRASLDRGATVIALERVTQLQAERLRARSRGALLAELSAGRSTWEDARRRAIALGFPPGPAALLPLAARRRDTRRPRAGEDGPPGWTELAAELRSALEVRGFPALIGPQESDLLGLVSLGRERGEARLERVADVVLEVLAAHGVDESQVALAIGRPGEWREAGQGLRRARRRSASAVAAPPRRWYDASTEGVGELVFELRDSSELAGFVREQLGPLLDDASDRGAVLLTTLGAYVEHGGRKAQTARALHLDRASLYPRLRRIEQRLGVDLDDPRTVLSLHLAIEALGVLRRAAPSLD